jgi:predicted nucleic acid-binding protein
MSELVVDTDVVSFPFKKWAEVTVLAQAAGRRIECADGWIAATALLYGADRVTHNRRDHLGVPGLKLISHGR